MDELIKSEFERVNDENNRQNHRIEKLEASVSEIHQITLSVEKLALNMEHMLTEIKNQSCRLTKLENEPAEKWNNATKTIISALLGAVCAFIMGRLL